MKKIDNREYRIIEATSAGGLTHRVNEYTACGAIPIGGVTHVPAIEKGHGAMYLQAIYKPEPEIG